LRRILHTESMKREKDRELEMSKKMIRFMFFQNERNLNRPGINAESMRELIKKVRWK
jgi:hypothetical protein